MSEKSLCDFSKTGFLTIEWKQKQETMLKVLAMPKNEGGQKWLWMNGWHIYKKKKEKKKDLLAYIGDI